MRKSNGRKTPDKNLLTKRSFPDILYIRDDYFDGFAVSTTPQNLALIGPSRGIQIAEYKLVKIKRFKPVKAL
jgi:hypothetical protein